MNPCPLQIPASAPVPQAAMPPFSLPLPVGPCPCRTIPNRSPGISPPTAPSPHPLPTTSPSSARLSPPPPAFHAHASARTPAHKSDPLFQRNAVLSLGLRHLLLAVQPPAGLHPQCRWPTRTQLHPHCPISPASLCRPGGAIRPSLPRVLRTAWRPETNREVTVVTLRPSSK